MEDGVSIDINSWTKPIINRLKQSDCRRRGWILEGFPRTRLQAVELQRVGFQPDYLIVLDGPDSVLKARDHGKKLDPQTGEFYHPLFNWTDDEEVLARLETPQKLESMEDETELFRNHKQALIQIHKNVSNFLENHFEPNLCFRTVARSMQISPCPIYKQKSSLTLASQIDQKASARRELSLWVRADQARQHWQCAWHLSTTSWRSMSNSLSSVKN